MLTTVVTQFKGVKQLIRLGIFDKKIVKYLWKLDSNELKKKNKNLKIPRNE
jgi:hypothetical protein